MATFFKSSPILYGKSAERFDREADKNKSLETPTLSDEENEILMQIFERSKNFKFWRLWVISLCLYSVLSFLSAKKFWKVVQISLKTHIALRSDNFITIFSLFLHYGRNKTHKTLCQMWRCFDSEIIKYLHRDMGAGFSVGEGVMMICQIEAAMCRDGMKLMIF